MVASNNMDNNDYPMDSNDYSMNSNNDPMKSNDYPIDSNDYPMKSVDTNETTNPDMIHENDYVLLKLPSGTFKLIQLQSQSISCGKYGSFKATDLIGYYYEQVLEITPDGLCLGSHDYLADFQVEKNQPTTADNRSLQDTQDNQKLTFEEIEAMKADGIKGDITHRQMIQKLVESNETFKDKTEFSKAKYIKRKMSKFSKIIVPLQPTAMNLLEMYRQKNMEKVRELRLDALSQILTMANIRPGSRVLLADDTGGLIALSVLERTSGKGDMIVFHDKLSPNLDIIRQTNLSKSIKTSYDTYPWYRFFEEYKIKPLTNDPVVDEAQAKRDSKFLSIDKTLKSGGYDSLIIASSFDNLQVLNTLKAYLAPSGNVVIYSSLKELILPVYNYMRNSQDFMYTNLYEGFMREYQVSVNESGVHPLMNMEGGGFIGFGVKVSSQGVGEVVKPKGEKKRQKSKELNYYEILNTSPTASLTEIRKAYIQESLKFHPDRNDSPTAPQQFQKVSEAYYILSDAQRRKEYDEQQSIPLSVQIDPTRIFGDVFEELMVPEVPNPSYFYQPMGLAAGIMLGFIILNVPGAVIGGYYGSRAGKVRDMKGVSVYEAFSRLESTKRREILSALAKKLLVGGVSSALGASASTSTSGEK